MLRNVALALAAAVTLAVGSAATASAGLGEQISSCAQMLGQPDNPPAVTCTHAGMTMSFANFGAMVAHMRETGC